MSKAEEICPLTWRERNLALHHRISEARRRVEVLQELAKMVPKASRGSWTPGSTNNPQTRQEGKDDD
jgi:hypothetical protein